MPAPLAPWVPPTNLSLLTQHFQRSLLIKAIENLESAHADLVAQYEVISPSMRGNHTIKFAYRMACQLAFETSRTPFSGMLQKIKENAKLVKKALVIEASDIAEFGLQMADVNVEEAEGYLLQLEEAVQAHVEMEAWMIWKGLLVLPKVEEGEVEVGEELC